MKTGNPPPPKKGQIHQILQSNPFDFCNLRIYNWYVNFIRREVIERHVEGKKKKRKEKRREERRGEKGREEEIRAEESREGKENV